MALTRRSLLFAVGDAHVYEAPKAAKGGDGVAYAAPRKRERAQVPGTAVSARAFRTKCVGCLLCVRECRRHVLKVSSRADHLFWPELDFRLGWCPPECNRCGAVCPTGALKPIAEETKRAVRLGVARWRAESCLTTKGVSCNACLRHCPVGAIAHDAEGHPVVDEAKCIGCGACEYFCPARPATGLQVEGRVD